MTSVTDLRKGVFFEDQGNLYQVLSYEHIKLGRGSATIKVKVKNIKNGSTVNLSFISGAKVQEVMVEKRALQFLYKDTDNAYFMEPQTFDQIAISLSRIQEDHRYLKEGENFSISFLKGDPLTLELPPKMDFTVKETGPSIRGNSATNIYKDAILENGLKTKVPLFVEAEDRVRIDTRTGEYSEKA